MHLGFNGPTIECDDARDAIVDAFDGGSLSRSVKHHARHCAECTALRKGLRSDRRALKALAPPGPLVIYLQMLLGGSHGPGSGPPSGGRLIPAFGTGLASLAVVAGLVVGSDALDSGNTRSPLAQPNQHVVEVAQAEAKSDPDESSGASKSSDNKPAPTVGVARSSAAIPGTQGSKAKTSLPISAESGTGTPTSNSGSTDHQSSSRSESNSKQESSKETTKQTSQTKTVKREKPRETEIGSGESSPTSGATPGTSGSSENSTSSGEPTEVGSTNSGGGSTEDTSSSAESTEPTQTNAKSSPKTGKKPPSIKRTIQTGGD